MSEHKYFNMISYGYGDLKCRKFRARGENQKERLGNIREDSAGPFMLINDHIDLMRKSLSDTYAAEVRANQLQEQINSIREGRDPDFYVIMNSDGVPLDMFPSKALAEAALVVLSFKAGHQTKCMIMELWK